jgi:excinuclease ABC subunit B
VVIIPQQDPRGAALLGVQGLLSAQRGRVFCQLLRLLPARGLRASSDTYIEKDSSINDEIERLRIAATSSLISRRDVIVVASVSCIYGTRLARGLCRDDDPAAEVRAARWRDHLAPGWSNSSTSATTPCSAGNFRVRGDVVDVMPAYLETAMRVEFWGDTIESLREFDPLTARWGRASTSFTCIRQTSS